MSLFEDGLPVCPYCGEAILPFEDCRPVNDGLMIWHAECLFRNTCGSVAHFEGRCSCNGGPDDEGDPPGMSRREGARAALALFRRQNGG